MPVLEAEKRINTKVIGVTEEYRQSALLQMYNHPERVIELYLKRMEIYVLLDNNGLCEDNPYSKVCLGFIKYKYAPYVEEGRWKIKQWQVTGGQSMPEYGDLCKFLGLNITIYF
jgi:hypothetical protein